MSNCNAVMHMYLDMSRHLDMDPKVHMELNLIQFIILYSLYSF
jgi:hypothetical protein